VSRNLVDTAKNCWKRMHYCTHTRLMTLRKCTDGTSILLSCTKTDQEDTDQVIESTCHGSGHFAFFCQTCSEQKPKCESLVRKFIPLLTQKNTSMPVCSAVVYWSTADRVQKSRESPEARLTRVFLTEAGDKLFTEQLVAAIF